MSTWSPCKRRDFIRALRHLGFHGPYHGTRHHYMVRGENRLAIPTNREYSILQLRMVIREVEGIIGRVIDADEWRGLL